MPTRWLKLAVQFSRLIDMNQTTLTYLSVNMMPNYRFLLCCCFTLIACGWLQAQSASTELLAFNNANLQHQRTAMYTLGGWAVANIGLGLALRGSTDGDTRYFHEMNALWNGVNLAIAGIGYFSIVGQDPASWDLATSFQKHQSFQKILLFNAGLDLGYIAGGLYLTERAKRAGVNQDRLRGFGKSIMLQGGFLFVFDLVNYFIANGRDGALNLMLGATSNGLGVVIGI